MEVIPLMQVYPERLTPSGFAPNVANGLNSNPNLQDARSFAQQVNEVPQVGLEGKTYLEATFRQVTGLAEQYQQGLQKINSNLQNAQSSLNTASLLGIQLDVYTLVLQQDLFAKVASKGSSIFESLMRNQ